MILNPLKVETDHGKRVFFFHRKPSKFLATQDIKVIQILPRKKNYYYIFLCFQCTSPFLNEFFPIYIHFSYKKKNPRGFVHAPLVPLRSFDPWNSCCSTARRALARRRREGEGARLCESSGTLGRFFFLMGDHFLFFLFLCVIFTPFLNPWASEVWATRVGGGGWSRELSWRLREMVKKGEVEIQGGAGRFFLRFFLVFFFFVWAQRPSKAPERGRLWSFFFWRLRLPCDFDLQALSLEKPL